MLSVYLAQTWLKDWLTVSVSSLSVMFIVFSPKEGKFISFEVFLLYFTINAEACPSKRGMKIDADMIFTLWKSLSKQGRTELNSALPFVTNWI